MVVHMCLRNPQFMYRAVSKLNPSMIFTGVYSRNLYTDKYPCKQKDAKSKIIQTKRHSLQLLGQHYPTDSFTNLTPSIVSKLGSNLHNKEHHPLNLIHQRIKNFFYARFQNRFGNPMFTMFDTLKPIVTVQQNFDSLFIPENHVSRSRSDTYYVNSTHLLRSHTSAHQEEIIKMGFDCFLLYGDVYRRDEIDSSHYPVFHQCEGVRLFSQHELFSRVEDPRDLTVFEKGIKTEDKQAQHTMETAKLLEHDLKTSLVSLAKALFGEDIEYKWVDAYFPFTHPSWELEIKYDEEWMEVLGCGIMAQGLLNNAGAHTKVGWAFGLGLDRLAMKLYDIPDIRLLWSEDPAFLNQFKVNNPNVKIKFKPFSKFQPCINDISFWIPDGYSSNDFYDLVRDIAGDIAESVTLIDDYQSQKTGKRSHCYKIVYRHMDKVFTQAEVNEIHGKIEKAATTQLKVEIR